MPEPTIIPVILQGDRCVVYESDPESEGKLSELRAYMKPIIQKGWNRDTILSSLLKHVGEVVASGTNVYECALVVDPSAHGKLVFVQAEFRTAGMTVRWQSIANHIDHYLSAIEEAGNENHN